MHLSSRGIQRFRCPGGALGSELFPGFGALTLSGAPAPTQNSTQLIFSAAGNLAEGHATVTLEDNTTYQVLFTVSGFTGGKVRILCYGATTAHLGATAEATANGNYSFQVTTSAAGSLVNQVRIQATGTGTSNTFTVSAVSVKKVLP